MKENEMGNACDIYGGLRGGGGAGRVCVGKGEG